MVRNIVGCGADNIAEPVLVFTTDRTIAIGIAKLSATGITKSLAPIFLYTILGTETYLSMQDRTYFIVIIISARKFISALFAELCITKNI